MNTIKLALGDVTLTVEPLNTAGYSMTATDCDGDVFLSRTFGTLAEAVAGVAVFAAYEYQQAAGEVEISVIA